MKTLRDTGAAIILTLALAVPVLAGEIDCPGVVAPPPPPPQQQTATQTVTSEITITLIAIIIDLIP